MTDYNDGKWHGWNGGECPVHPESQVVVVYESCSTKNNGQCPIAGTRGKLAPWANVIAFRVTKPYVEPPKPREVWVAFDGGGGSCDVSESKDTLEVCGYKNMSLFREVLP